LSSIKIDTKKALSHMPDTIEKQLKENQAICPYCNGFGLIRIDRRDWLIDPREEYHDDFFHTCHFCNSGVVNVCRFCGEFIEKTRGDYCNCEGYQEHRKTLVEQAEKERFDKAEKITLDEAINRGIKAVVWGDDDYIFFDQDDVYEWIECEYDNNPGLTKDNCPDYVWATDAIHFSFDVGNILEDACSDLHEDAYDNLVDIEELEAFCENWIAKQDGATSYYPDYKIAVLIDKDKISWEEDND